MFATSSFVIDDSNADFHADPSDPRCGTLPPKHIFGSLPFTAAADFPVIPMEKWPDLISDVNRNEAFAYHAWLRSPIGVLNQGQIGYCHAFSAVEGAMVQREIEGLAYIDLSPSSVGAPITGYQNQGAVITDDLRQMVDVGIASTLYVPRLTTSSGDFKTGWKEDAVHNRVKLFTELAPRNFMQQVTALLLGFPLCVGLNYWGHAVLDLAVVDLYPNLAATNPFRYGILFLNSWDKSWGDGGTGVRAQSKAVADQAYIPRQVTPYSRASAKSRIAV